MDLQELLQSKPATRQASKNDEKLVDLIKKFEAKYVASSTVEIYRDAKIGHQITGVSLFFIIACFANFKFEGSVVVA